MKKPVNVGAFGAYVKEALSAVEVVFFRQFFLAVSA